ncbi:uncharacterized protein LOC123303388 [Chrysoperla carnea]|uniref:uncharacterized protein LOC123303388 n=1 Tax=Chrysoperla carnea TaxID=189513 RepID=UPI001D0950C6|nr:uncharacterized protein LOC123303388 [Chrysoperla carnea]
MENNVKENCKIGDNVNTSKEDPDQYNFENAIKETGFGKYNVMLIVMCGLAILGFASESFSLAYIIPAASCELELTTNMKGVLASIYLGENSITICEQFNNHTNGIIKIDDGIETNCTPSISAVMLQYSFIFGSLRFINYLIVGLLVKRIGSKKILIFWFFVCMLSCGLMHTTQSKWITITLVCICVMSGITVGVINSFTPDMYPTKYRATAISITYMFGRIGGVLGSVVMGNLLESQCSLSFYFSAGVLLVCGVLAFQLPSNKK